MLVVRCRLHRGKRAEAVGDEYDRAGAGADGVAHAPGPLRQVGRGPVALPDADAARKARLEPGLPMLGPAVVKPGTMRVVTMTAAPRRWTLNKGGPQQRA